MRPKFDENHGQIVRCYKQLGCSVANTAAAGGGVPDLFVGCGNITDPVEIKTERGKLLPTQQRFAQEWRGSEIRCVRTLSDVELHVRMMRLRATPLTPAYRVQHLEPMTLQAAMQYIRELEQKLAVASRGHAVGYQEPPHASPR